MIAEETHKHFDRSDANMDGQTSVRDLYIASPSEEADHQAITAAGWGVRVGLSLIGDTRQDRGYPATVADHTFGCAERPYSTTCRATASAGTSGLPPAFPIILPSMRNGELICVRRRLTAASRSISSPKQSTNGANVGATVCSNTSICR